MLTATAKLASFRRRCRVLIFLAPDVSSRFGSRAQVCLARADLERLWTGDPQTTDGVQHCHDDGPPLQIYTGWDGDLYCVDKNPCKDYPNGLKGYCPKAGVGTSNKCGWSCCPGAKGCKLGGEGYNPND